MNVFGQMHLNKIKILSEVSCRSCTNTNGEQQDFCSVVVFFQMTDMKLV